MIHNVCILVSKYHHILPRAIKNTDKIVNFIRSNNSITDPTNSPKNRDHVSIKCSFNARLTMFENSNTDVTIPQKITRRKGHLTWRNAFFIWKFFINMKNCLLQFAIAFIRLLYIQLINAIVQPEIQGIKSHNPIANHTKNVWI